MKMLSEYALNSRAWQRVGAPIAIILLPLLGFWGDRAVDEPITQAIGPALYALYAVGLIAYAAITVGRFPVIATSLAAGILGTAAVASAFMQLIGLFPAYFLFMYLLMQGSLGVHLPMIERLMAIVAITIFLIVLLSPWLTALALGDMSLRALHRSAARTRRTLTIAAASVGVCLTVGAMVWAQRADAGWLASRVQAFETDDLMLWEQSLREIQGNWLCGRRRCLQPICGKLIRRFGEGKGETGFAPALGFVFRAPTVPHDVDERFINIFSHPVRQVCAYGD
jgi:hypothetical protein